MVSRVGRRQNCFAICLPHGVASENPKRQRFSVFARLLVRTNLKVLVPLRASPKRQKIRPSRSIFVFLVSRVGLEPTTPSLRGSCSNQLSYRPAHQYLLLYQTLSKNARAGAKPRSWLRKPTINPAIPRYLLNQAPLAKP